MPYIIGENGSGNTVIVGRSAEINIIDEKRASEKQLISREHARFVSKQSGIMYTSPTWAPRARLSTTGCSTMTRRY